jgi:hypothetical protein
MVAPYWIDVVSYFTNSPYLGALQQKKKCKKCIARINSLFSAIYEGLTGQKLSQN